MKIQLKKLHPDAKIPVQAHEGIDAGFDLCALESGWIRPGERVLFKTGISIDIPRGLYGKIESRSGLALKQGLCALGGVIDSGYLGDIGVILLNTQNGDESNSVRVEAGQKIAQLLIKPIVTEIQWELVDKLDETARADGGFGSSDAYIRKEIDKNRVIAALDRHSKASEQQLKRE